MTLPAWFTPVPGVVLELGHPTPLYLPVQRAGDERRRFAVPGDKSITVVADARFWTKVDKDGPVWEAHGTSCWEWTGALTSAGYGTFTQQRRRIYSHRAAYEALVGPIPAGLEIDHLCRNTRCLRPDHLEPVPPRVNKARGDSPSAHFGRRTCCAHGHEYTPENTRWRRHGRNGLSRRCVACALQREEERKLRRWAQGRKHIVKMDAARAAAVREDRRGGMTLKDLARKYGVGTTTIQRVVYALSWTTGDTAPIYTTSHRMTP